MLAAFTICCVCIGWYVVRSQNQRACVEWILARGGEVTYSYRYKQGKYDPHAVPPGPKWLREPFGLDYFDRVWGIDLSNKDVSELPDLKSVAGIKTLWVRNTNVDDLAFISNLSQLENLWIANTKIKSLDPISRNKKLNWLGLEGTAIQDLSPLDGLAELRTLNLSKTNIPQEEIKRFQAVNPNCAILGADD